MASFNEVLILLLLILTNGLFVVAEMSIVSSRKVRLQSLADQGNAKARTALELVDSPNRFLSTVQIGITLIGIFTGAFGGATLVDRLADQLAKVPILAAHSRAIALPLVVFCITYLSLVFGELVPKRLAMNRPEPLALAIAQPMQLLSAIATPVVKVLSLSTDLILRLLGSEVPSEPQVTEEEIKILIEQGAQSGIVEAAERDIVGRVFQLGDRSVASVMTPRPEIMWLDLADSAAVNREKLCMVQFARIPICQGGLDNIVGLVKVTDLLAQILAGQSLDFTTQLHRPLFVPKSTSVLKILELFKQTGIHTGIIVDEYGVIQGLVTLNDILLELAGDMPALDQENEPQIIQREDGSWLLDGMLSVEDFFEMFHLEEVTDPQRGNYHTMGGFVITHLGRIPTSATHFEWRNLRIEVVDMDGNRVDKILVMPVSR
ncbi:MAG: HlyC/CorC family transporter [Oscillatoriales cyanobacterium RM2_1_1]|nr:HlyC/CorC family transporter [Oscillatoriales cyanobacterium SM2_3_0]NJO46037.1 HlyC/CorC family transporter [Oscillatoriales cyanobacterium RM2_1_1]